MRMYVTLDDSSLGTIVKTAGHADLACATVVLEHQPAGRLGFEGTDGDLLLRAIVDDAVTISVENKPAWQASTGSGVTCQELRARTLRSAFRRMLSCSRVSPLLTEELSRVTQSKVLSQKNILLGRLGRVRLLPPPNQFDAWISDGGGIQFPVVDWILGVSETTVGWLFSEWGMHARVLARTPEEALAPALRAGRSLHVPVVTVNKNSDMPSW